jgi:hypothetical protein
MPEGNFTYGDTVLKYTGKTENGEVAGSGPVYEADQFVAEAAHFADCILQKGTSNTG